MSFAWLQTVCRTHRLRQQRAGAFFPGENPLDAQMPGAASLRGGYGACMTGITTDRSREFDGANGAAFFDVDRTLVAGASALTMVRPFQRRGLVTRRQTIRAGLAQLAYTARGTDDAGIERSYDAAKELMKGWDVELMRRVISEELESRLHPTVFREALERVEMHHRQGQAVYAVSATMIDLVQPIADLLGLEGALGTELEIVDGLFTGEVTKVCHGDGKASRDAEFAAEHGIDLAKSSAYSDSISDEHFLRAVGRPYAVNPDAKLRKLAEAEGWGMLAFRTRIKAPVHRRRSTHVGMAAVVVAAFAGNRARNRRRKTGA